MNNLSIGCHFLNASQAHNGETGIVGMKGLSTILLLFFALLSCSQEEEDINRSPVLSGMTKELLSSNPFEYEFQVDVFDPDSDPLTYFWDFGDGTVFDGTGTERHLFASDKKYLVKVTVSDGINPGESAFTNVSTLYVNVSIDPSIVHQEIDGFGGFGAEKVWWASEPFFTEAHVDRLINDLGVTILRDNIPVNFEPVNDNDDPNDLDLSKFNISYDTEGIDSHLGQHLPWLKAMGDAGLDKLVASIWSPPIWMKHINHRGNGINDGSDPNAYSAPPYTNDPDGNTNQLKVEHYDEFAEYCVAYVKTIKAETGIDLYALSIQNEPIFSQFYASCVYNATAYRDVLKVVGKRFEDEGIQTKLFGQEDVRVFDRIQNFINVVNADPVARDYLDIFAIHNYGSDGISPSDEGPTNWQNSRAIADANEQKLWMSETSGFDGNWEGAMALAKSIYNALKFGKINAWIYWQMSDGSDGALIRNGTPTQKFYASKHYYRYIRPGAVQVESATDDEDVLVLAFKHDMQNTATLILINNASVEKVVKLNDSDQDYVVYQSHSKANFDDSRQLKDGTVTLRANSITTLYSE